jgi:hypothetical protein
MFDSSKLFTGENLSLFLNGKYTSSINYIDVIPKNDFFNKSSEQIIEEAYSKSKIIPLTIFQDDIERSEILEISSDPNHLKIRIYIPYTGDNDLWSLKSNPFTQNYCYGNCSTRKDKDGRKTLTITHLFLKKEFSLDQVEKEIDRNLESISQNLISIKEKVNNHNQKLHDGIRDKVLERMAFLKEISKIEEELKFPKRNEGE